VLKKKKQSNKKDIKDAMKDIGHVGKANKCIKMRDENNKFTQKVK